MFRIAVVQEFESGLNDFERIAQLGNGDQKHKPNMMTIFSYFGAIIWGKELLGKLKTNVAPLLSFVQDTNITAKTKKYRRLSEEQIGP